MEETIIENSQEIKGQNENNSQNSKNNNAQQIAGAIIIAGLIIAGAILLKGNSTPTNTANNPGANITLAKVTASDRSLGNPKAKVTLVMYEDFQCPFCGAVFGATNNTALLSALKQRDPTWTAFEPAVMTDYVNSGTVQLVYRDYAFLGAESTQSAEAARCAEDQGQFWQYHDYLFSHQNGEDQGAFSNTHLEAFAKTLGLDSTTFNQCLESGKYAQAITASKAEGDAAGVTGTPKGFILKNGKIVSTIDGAESYSSVKVKIDAALK
jgi:protein-disulfide isomerase